jgi:hypothetical protein
MLVPACSVNLRLPQRSDARLPCAVRSRALPGVLSLVLLATVGAGAAGGESPAVTHYQEHVQPILIDFCYRCHADGNNKGGVAFDGFASDEELVRKRDLWWNVLKNVRAGIMPPARKPHPREQDLRILADWIKRDVFGINPADPDPGRGTIRRLNRAEYRNTVRDLTGYDFKAEEEFPPDDSGYGFDNIGDVLTVSPLLLEKYLQAAESIVAAAVPTVSRLMPERTYRGTEFHPPEGRGNGDRLTFYKKAELSRLVTADPAGEYRINLELAVDGSFEFDPGRCTVTFKLDDKELLKETYAWQDGKAYHYSFKENLLAGDHRMTFKLDPLTAPDAKRRTSLDFRIISLKLQGPLDPKHWTRPRNYERFFNRDDPPATDAERHAYAREVLDRFASQAFRRPIDQKSLERLTSIAEAIYRQPGQRFEQGVARAIVAVLASPRFVFRVETSEPHAGAANSAHPLVDEYALASRMSYFLWSTMPDAELFGLAQRGELRKNLAKQAKRMLEDDRGEALTRNFVGQWLQVRDVDGFTINTRAVLRQDGNSARVQLDGDLRRAIRGETEMLFAHVSHEDKSVLDLIDSDYTFLNAKLAQFYGIKDVTGSQMLKVTLPKDSPRGGVLTHASFLLVTSNPTRTSPVKRGQFILDNILGTPTPPAPADIPPLEDAKKEIKDREPTGRELLALHRSKPLCFSCHNRMDPLGLSLENFNALGMWRDKERKEPIDATGQLISGESFHDVRELKRILKEKHRLDFYRCISEKLLTYALGRGLEYLDVETVDKIVDRMDREGGRFSALLSGVIESAPFQKRRSVSAAPKQSSGSRELSFQARTKP